MLVSEVMEGFMEYAFVYAIGTYKVHMDEKYETESKFTFDVIDVIVSGCARARLSLPPPA